MYTLPYTWLEVDRSRLAMLPRSSVKGIRRNSVYFMPTQDVLCRGMTVSLVLQVGGDRAGMRSEHEAICRSGVDHMSRSPTREIHLSRHHLLECTHDGLADIVAACGSPGERGGAGSVAE